MSSQLRRNLRLCTADGIIALPIVYFLTPGNYVMAAFCTGLLGLPPDSYGVLASLPFWGNCLQSVLIPFINRQIAPQPLTIICAALQALCWLGVALALPALVSADAATTARWLFWFCAFSAAVTALTAVSWTSWVQDWVPHDLRGKYFGIRNRLVQVGTIVFLVLVGELLERMDTSRGALMRAFQVLIIGMVLLRFISVVLQARMKTGDTRHRDDAVVPWKEQVRVLARTPAFLWFMAYGALWGVAANSFGPFYPVFLLEHVGLSLREVGFLTILTSVGGALSYPAWGALADRFGNKPVMLVGLGLWQVQNYLWFIVTPENKNLLYFMWLWGGVFSAGHILGLFAIQLRIIPPAAKTLAISLNLALTAAVTAVAPMIGGAVLRTWLTPERVALDVYHAVFLVQPTLALLSCLLLQRVGEPQAQSFTSVVGAMRNIRTLAGVLGLGFLTEQIFFKARAKPKARRPPRPGAED